MLLLIDNYDSFTYNLFQYFSELGEKVLVVRNNKTTIGEIEALKPERIVISPGPRRRKMPASPMRSSNISAGNCRCLASVWDINVLAIPMGVSWGKRRSSCTVNPH